MIKEVTSKWWIKIKIGKDDQHIVSVGKNSGNKAKMHGNWENVRNIHKIFEKENEKQGMRSETYSKTRKKLVCPAMGQLHVAKFLLPYRVNII